jgi:protoporphyrinogen/coproporphyrinogen III oxidase
MKRVAIVGSGVAALACAVTLKEKGIGFTVFEKDPMPGGKLVTDKIGDFTVEGGPDSFLPEKRATVDLIKKVGLEDALLQTNDEHKGTYIFSKGRLHRLPEGVMLMVPTMIMPLVRSTLVSMPGKLRMGMELFVPKKHDEADESLARFVTRRLGRECLERIAEPLVAGIHTSNPDNMSVKATFPRFIDMESKHGSLIKGMVRAMRNAPKPAPSNGKSMTYFMSLRGGMQQLVHGCVSSIGPDVVRTSSHVKGVTRGPEGFQVLLERGIETFDAVVLSSPSYSSSDIVHDLSSELAERLSSIEWSSTATISLAFRKADIVRDLPGFGFIVPRIEGRKVNAATWSSVKWSYRAPDDSILIRSFVGGGHHEELVNISDEELVTVVLEELKGISGILATPLFSKVYRWRRSMPRYTVGHLERVAAIDAALSRWPGLYVIGSSYRGIGIGDCVKSGFDAADKVSEFLRADP